MRPDIFTYKDAFTFDEYASMCDRFKGLSLPGTDGMDIAGLAADYVFCVSMNRIQTGRKNTLRRFFGSLFEYSYTVEGTIEKPDTAIAFTGDGDARKDYISNIRNVAAQCDRAVVFLINRKKKRFRPWRAFSVFADLISAVRLDRIVYDFDISFDMAVAIRRAVVSGKELFNLVRNSGAGRLVTFCDQWSEENALTQLANKAGMQTATLQHGNGTEIFYGSCSRYYLANSLLSAKKLVDCGIAQSGIRVLGPMKYAGCIYRYPSAPEVRNVGVVFDGARNYENNVEMLDAVHEALVGQTVNICLRLHPNNKPEEYAAHITENDRIYADLNEFEKDVDVCIVYNSSMYTDMLYKKIPVYRYKNGRIDLYPELCDRGLESADDIRALMRDLRNNRDMCVEEQMDLFKQVFGDNCDDRSYKRFFASEF